MRKLKEEGEAIGKSYDDKAGQNKPKQEKDASEAKKQKFSCDPGSNEPDPNESSEDPGNKIGSKCEKVSSRVKSPAVVPCDPSPRRKEGPKQNPDRKIIELKPEDIAPSSQDFQRRSSIMPLEIREQQK